jgi:hypothetical protein
MLSLKPSTTIEPINQIKNPPARQTKIRESLPTSLLIPPDQQMDRNQVHQVEAEVEALAEHEAKPDDPEMPKPGKPKRNESTMKERHN